MGDSLLPLDQVRSHLRVLGQHYVGVREVPVREIVGTVDRAVDFDQFFRPRRRALRRRLDAMSVAFGDGPMPPITVYEAGGLYFVVDGHHRVALARRNRAEFIDAEVTQVRTSHRLPPDVDVLALIHTEQHRHFKQHTRLLVRHPEAKIELSRPTGYRQLLDLVEAHGYQLSHQVGALVVIEDATAHWYETEYLPAVRAMHDAGLPGTYRRQTNPPA